MIQSLKNSISTVSERPIFYIYPPLLTILSWIYYPDLHCCRWGQVDVQQKGNNQVQKKKKKRRGKKKKDFVRDSGAGRGGLRHES